MPGLRGWRGAWKRWKAAGQALSRRSPTQQREVRAALREGRAVRDPELAVLVVELAEAEVSMFSGGIRAPVVKRVAAIIAATYVVMVTLNWLTTGDLGQALVSAAYFPLFLLVIAVLVLPLGRRRREVVRRAAEMNRPLAAEREAEAFERAAADEEHRQSRSLEQQLADLDGKLAEWRNDMGSS